MIPLPSAFEFDCSLTCRSGQGDEGGVSRRLQEGSSLLFKSDSRERQTWSVHTAEYHLALRRTMHTIARVNLKPSRSMKEAGHKSPPIV